MLPEKIALHKGTNTLELVYRQQPYQLPAEYLRVLSPSAEVRGHGPGQAVLQHGKAQVRLDKVEAVGNYALKLHFSDGHNTGLYSWDYLWQLASQQEARWQAYLAELHQAGLTREPDTQVVKFL